MKINQIFGIDHPPHLGNFGSTSDNNDCYFEGARALYRELGCFSESSAYMIVNAHDATDRSGFLTVEVKQICLIYFVLHIDVSSTV